MVDAHVNNLCTSYSNTSIIHHASIALQSQQHCLVTNDLHDVWVL